MSLTTDPNDPKLKEGQKNETGQHEIYLVLSEEERVQGFVRPYRDAYKHVGRKVEPVEIKGEILSLEEGVKDCSEWAKNHYTKANGYAAYLKYPESESPLVGTFLKIQEYQAIKEKKEYVGGCGSVTTMGKALSETYARDPKFYGATFCCNCNKHLPVGEFVWTADGEIVGS